MKTILLSIFAIISAVAYFHPSRFDSFDITSDAFDISWDDITEDLWP